MNPTMKGFLLAGLILAAAATTSLAGFARGGADCPGPRAGYGPGGADAPRFYCLDDDARRERLEERRAWRDERREERQAWRDERRDERRAWRNERCDERRDERRAWREERRDERRAWQDDRRDDCPFGGLGPDAPGRF